MASPAAIFFIFLVGLIIASIVFDFWIWLVIAAVIFVGIIIAIGVVQHNDEVKSRRRVNPRRTPLTSKEKFQRDLRDRIDDEWQKQSDDLEKWR